MYQPLSYPLKVWITSVLSGPFLLLSLSTQPDVVHYIFSVGFVEFYFVAVVIGGLVSTPCFLFLWLCYTLLIRFNWRTSIVRISLILISLLCCITIFALFSLPNLSSIWKGGNVKLMGSYAIPLTIGLMLFKMNKSKFDFDEEA